MNGRWDIFTIASPAGVSYRIFEEGVNSPDVDIAHIPTGWSSDGSNARLIASAPELLAILKAVISIKVTAEVIGRARALIERLEG